MKIVKASATIESEVNGREILRSIERAGRICYQSIHKILSESHISFVEMLLERGHLSVVEHESVSVRFIVDRGISHEIVRHRLASYSQESTRYCNYSKKKFGNEITVIEPLGMTELQREDWSCAMSYCEGTYFIMLRDGCTPQIARSVLPNSLKTELVMTANLREWRHFFSLRAAKPAHPQMREVACPLLREFRHRIPILFDDVGDPDCDEEGRT